VKTRPAARKPTIATWYVLSASEATVTVTPVMQKNMKTSVHHAKLGKPPWIADIMELTKAMIQARMPIDMVASAKGSPMMRPRLKPDDLWP